MFSNWRPLGVSSVRWAMSSCWMTFDVSERRSLMASLLWSTLFDTSWTLQLSFWMSSLTDLSFRSVVRTMSDERFFCTFTYTLKSSTVWRISFGTWFSFTLVKSLFPSTAFGWVALMSIPPRPIGCGAVTMGAAINGWDVNEPKRPVDCCVWAPKTGGGCAAGWPKDNAELGVAVVKGFSVSVAAAAVVVEAGWPKFRVVAGWPKLNVVAGWPKLKVVAGWPKLKVGAAVVVAAGWAGCPNENPLAAGWACGCGAIVVAPNDKEGAAAGAAACCWPNEKPDDGAWEAGVEKAIDDNGWTTLIGAVGCAIPNPVDCCCCWGWTVAIGVDPNEMPDCCSGCWVVDSENPVPAVVAAGVEKLNPLGFGVPNDIFGELTCCCVLAPPSEKPVLKVEIEFYTPNRISFTQNLLLWSTKRRERWLLCIWGSEVEAWHFYSC